MALTKITGELIETSPTLSTSITLTSTDAGSSAGPDLILYRNSSSPADADYLGQIQFKGRHDGSGDEIYAKVTGKISDASSGTEDGLIETAVKGNGSFVIVSRQKSDKLQLLNGAGLEVDGSVGIGTTSPIRPLHLHSSTDGDIVFAITNNSTGATTSDGFNIIVEGPTPDVLLRNRENSNMRFLTNNTERVRIASDGDVGIGTTSPAVMLDVRGEVAIDYNASHGLRFYNSGRSNWSSIGNRETSTGADLQFKTGNATALNLNNSGDLTHMGTSAFTAGVTSFRKRNLNSVDMAEVAVGGGYAANDTFIVYDTTNNATRFKVTYQGTIWAMNTTIQSLSDERFKENIRDLDKGLADILKLKPRRFDWIAEEGSGRKDISGFIAQECEAAGFEEFVDTTDFNEANKNLKSFGQSGLIPALVKSIQELSTKLEAAEARITALEG